MSQIDLDQELVDFLRTNESLTGETPSEFIRKLLQKRQPRRAAGQRARSENTGLAVFLQILSEIHENYPATFPAVESVRGKRRVYFSTDPKIIEAAGTSTRPVQIPGTVWWVTSSTSTHDKASFLEKVLFAVGCSAEDRHRWLSEFTGSELPPGESDDSSEDDDPFKI